MSMDAAMIGSKIPTEGQETLLAVLRDSLSTATQIEQQCLTIAESLGFREASPVAEAPPDPPVHSISQGLNDLRRSVGQIQKALSTINQAI